MPLYEYRCSVCGHKFENLARSMEDAAPKCPLCGSEAVERTVGSFGIAGGGAAQESPAPRVRFG